MMLLVAEVKEFVPARFGFKAIIKHVPNQALSLDEGLYRRLATRFENELTLWSASADLHMVLIATFFVTGIGVPSVVELSLMPTSEHWLPIDTAFERQLVDTLIAKHRVFVKPLRYNRPVEETIPAAILTDVGELPVALHIDRGTAVALGPRHAAEPHDTLLPPPWTWNPMEGAISPLPVRDRAKCATSPGRFRRGR